MDFDSSTPTISVAGIDRDGRADSFTIIELLVAISILVVLLVLASQVISRTSVLWIYSNYKMTQAREARVGFDALISRLSAATVDSYYGYQYAPEATGQYTATGLYVPTNYTRRSELRFISGPAGDLTGLSSCPTHAVFFLAPFGIVSDTANYGQLPGLLNIFGFYIQWSNVDLERPSILSGTDSYRFRLMQFIQPADSMALYSLTTNYPTYTQVTTSPSWQLKALSASPSGIRPLANNVVALLLLPVLKPTALNTTDNPLVAPGFLYNSEIAPISATPFTSPVNRLPPVIRVIMYTIDDKSAKRLPQTAAVPNLYVDSSSNPLFVDPAKLFPNPPDIGDLQRFENTLTANKLAFRRFEATVQPPPQPWNTRN